MGLKGMVQSRCEQVRARVSHKTKSLLALKMSRMYMCQICKRNLPCCYEGDSSKPTIILKVAWTNSPLTVVSSGEQCYPCPNCEKDINGEAKINHWEQAEMRLHKRLRQHFTRHHHAKLSDVFTPVEISDFYDQARKLRCELIHGPPGEHRGETSSASESSCIQQPPTPEEGPGPGPSGLLRKRARNLSSRESNAIPLPSKFIDWLAKEVSPATATTYEGIVKSFLHFQKTKGENGEFTDVWDYNSVKNFLDSRQDESKPTTLHNYLMALLAAQRYARLEGIVEPSSLTKLRFDSLEKQVCRRKLAHSKRVKEEKRKTGIGLREVKEKILNCQKLQERYDEHVQHCKRGLALGQSDYRWATGYAILTLQASNFKRNGNLAKITFSHGMRRLKAALKKRTSCELEISNATKTGGVEVFCIVNRHRIKILHWYGKYIRASAMGTGTCPAFFLNSVGAAIMQMAPFIKSVGKSVGLPSLTIMDLRSQLETEAALHGDKIDRSEVASHLAHTEGTRNRHYLLTDRRRSRNAALQVEKLVNEAEAPMDSDSDDISKDVTRGDGDTDTEAASESDSNTTKDGNDTPIHGSSSEEESSTPASSPVTSDDESSETDSKPGTSAMASSPVTTEDESGKTDSKPGTFNTATSSPAMPDSSSEDDVPNVRVLRHRTITTQEPPSKRRK